MFFSMYARGSLVILLLVTYILTDEPSNQKRVFSMYVPSNKMNKLSWVVCWLGYMFLRLYVRQVVCSPGCMFARLYVRQVVCWPGCMFAGLYVGQVVCWPGCMFAFWGQGDFQKRWIGSLISDQRHNQQFHLIFKEKIDLWAMVLSELRKLINRSAYMYVVSLWTR